MDLLRALDRVVGVVSPRAELRRIQARAAVALARRHYEGASVGRRTGGWRTSPTSQNAAAQGELSLLRDRARYLVRNNAWGLRAADLYEDDVVGTGIVPAFESETPGVAERLMEIWREHAETTQIDADGRLTVYGLQALAVRTIFESGEVLIRRRWRRPTDGLPLPLQIQLLEPDHLDVGHDLARTASGGRILQGIQLDPIGRREGYWLWPEHPGEIAWIGQSSSLVPAAEILHAYRVVRAGQLRGVPALAAVVVALRDLDEYRDAQVIKQKIAACLTGFIEDSAETGDPPVPGAVAQTPESLEPGALVHLSGGKKIVFSQPPTVGEYESFLKGQLRYLASGTGTTYESLSGDWSDVNFSSGRLGFLQVGRGIERWRWNVMISQILDPLARWVVDAAVLSRRVPADARYRVRWTPPRRAMWDPKNEVPAQRDRIRAGMTSLSEVIREDGQDPRTVLEELRRDLDLLAELGLRVESDPSVALRGSPPAPDQETPRETPPSA